MPLRLRGLIFPLAMLLRSTVGGLIFCALGTELLAATQGLTWADRRINMEATYAQAVVGTASGKNGLYVIASTVGGVPSFAWSANGLAWQQGEVTPNPEGTWEFVSALAYVDGTGSGNRTWAAVGPSGLLLLSNDNARTWQRQPPVMDGMANFIGIAGGEGILLASGRGWKPDEHGGGTVGGAVFISRDRGLTWEQSDVDTEYGLTTPLVLPGVWIVAGEGGVIARSTDEGATWEVTQGAATGSYHSIAAGNGTILLVGAAGGGTVVERSVDNGATWQVVIEPGDGWIAGVAYGNRRFVLSGGTQAQSGAMSFNGLQWIPARGTGAWGTLGFGPKGFLAVGGTYGRMSTVANPPAVTPESAPEIIPGTLGRSIGRTLRSKPGGATFFAVGLPPGVKLSANGTFTGKPTQAGNYQVFLYALRSGFAGNVRTVLFSISDPNGPGGAALAWVRYPSGLENLGYGAEATAFSGTGFLSVGSNSTGYAQAVRSTNGRSWALCDLPITTEANDWGRLRGLAGVDSLWMIAGKEGLLLRSQNSGTTWSTLPSPGGNSTSYSGLATDRTKFLLVGQKPRLSGGEGAAAYVSQDDGETWEEVEFPDLVPFRLAAYSGGKWWIGGQEGTVLRAEDPLGPWEDVSLPSSQDVRGISAHGPVVVAALAGGAVFRSLDGAESWQPGAAGSGPWPLNLVNYQGLFVLSGGDKAAGSSSRDGLVWQLPASGGAYGPVALAAAEGQVRFVSLNGEEVWEAVGPWVPGVLQPAEPPVFSIGESLFLQLLASGNPTSWMVTGLPSGLFFSPMTQTLSGATRRLGKIWVSFNASNSAGTSHTTRIPITFTTPFPIAVGNYQAVLPPGTLNEEMGGNVQLQVNRLGVVSGRVDLGMRRFSFRGELSAEGAGTFLLDEPPGPQLLLEATVGMEESTAGQLTGRVVQGLEELPVNGFRNPWHARSNPATAWVGRYHIALFADDTEPAAPAGSGYNRLSISANGRCSASGRLANHAALTWSGFLPPSGGWAMFARQGRAGCVMGNVPIDISLAGKPLVGTVRWTSLSSPAMVGFQADLAVRGSLYQRPARGTMLWNLPLTADNATFFRSTQTAEPVTIEENHRIALAPGTSLEALSLQLSPGAWRGTFRSSSGRRTSLQGLILTEPWNLAAGYARPDGVSEAVELRPTTEDD